MASLVGGEDAPLLNGHSSNGTINGCDPESQKLSNGADCCSHEYGAVESKLSTSSHLADKQRKLLDYFQPGSIKASVFNLCSATLGAGALALPFAFASAGVFAGVLLLFAAAFASIYSIRLLVAVRDKTGLNSYEDLSLHCFGKGMCIFVELNIILFCFGTCVAYIIAIGDILTPVCSLLFTDGFIHNRSVLVSLFVLMVMLPLSLVDKMSTLRFSSLLGVCAIGFLVFAIVTRSTQYLVHHTPTHLKLFDAGWGLFRALPMIMFAFTNQVNIFSIYTELQRPNARRMNKVVDRSFAVSALIYLLIGLFGYLHFNVHTKADILKNLSLSDPLIAVAQLGVGLTLVLAYPLNIFPARFTIECMFWSHAPHSDLRFSIISSALVLGSLALALVIPSIDSVFSLMGATTSSVVCFILPAAFYLNIMGDTISQLEKYCAMMLLGSGMILGVLATYATFAGM